MSKISPFIPSKMNLLSGREKEFGIITIISIIALSNGLLFYFQSSVEDDLKKSVFEQQKQIQVQSTKEIAQHVQSDISLVMSMLYGLANSRDVQEGKLGSDDTTKLLQETYDTFNLTIDRLFILDKNDTMVASVIHSAEFFLGEDFSFRSWVKETKNTLTPVFSGDFERARIFRVFITYPVISRETDQYIGMIVTSIPTVPFFAHYGNVEKIETQFLVAYDTKGTMLANGASKTFVGKNFFGNYTQQFINHNQALNNLTRNMLAGSAGFAIYNYGSGERLTTSYPVVVNDKPKFFIQIVTPTTEIYLKINNVLSVQKIRLFSLFAAASTIAIVILVILLKKWNIILTKEVKRRTRELEESYKEMKVYLDKVLKEVKKQH
ncbi:MAG: cache domain-containing protein [Nitrososphaerota archaeon]